jgi:hypothetical protein
MSCLTAAAVEDGVRNVGKKNKFVGVPDIDFPLVLTAVCWFASLHRNLFKDDWLSSTTAATEKKYFCSSSASTIFPPESSCFRSQSYRAPT